MLTIFAIPKAFHGHIATIQRNAIYSWTLLRPKCEIILFGTEEGIREAAAEFKVGHIPDVSCNEYGTPFLGPIFNQVKHLAQHSLLCYVNADIILLDDFIKAVQRIHFRRFLMIGQRWDLDLKEAWPYKQPDWTEQLQRYISNGATLHAPAGSDYFVFPRNQYMGEFLPFVVGRPGWDNWFIYQARKLGIPVIDATKATRVIHQNHDYSHVPEANGQVWWGPEANRNVGLIEQGYKFTLRDSTHVLTSRGIWPAFGYKYIRRRWRSLPILVPNVRSLLRLAHVFKQRFKSETHLKQPEELVEKNDLK